MNEIGTSTHFISAWTTYLHGPKTDKMGMGANFIHAVLQIERSVKGPIDSQKIPATKSGRQKDLHNLEGKTLNNGR
jgi:hypothetical protein